MPPARPAPIRLLLSHDKNRWRRLSIWLAAPGSLDMLDVPTVILSWRRGRQGKAHDLHACIDVNYVASDAPAQIAGKKDRRISHFRRIHVPPQRSDTRAAFQHFGKIANSP